MTYFDCHNQLTHCKCENDMKRRKESEWRKVWKVMMNKLINWYKSEVNCTNNR
jgi:hypothetical protein